MALPSSLSPAWHDTQGTSLTSPPNHFKESFAACTGEEIGRGVCMPRVSAGCMAQLQPRPSYSSTDQAKSVVGEAMPGEGHGLLRRPEWRVNVTGQQDTTGDTKPTQEEDVDRDADVMGKEDRGILGAVPVSCLGSEVDLMGEATQFS